jgi:hypothetical protein
MTIQDKIEFGNKAQLAVVLSEIDLTKGLVAEVTWYIGNQKIPTLDDHFLVYVVSEFFLEFSRVVSRNSTVQFERFDYTTEFRDGFDVFFNSDTRECCIRVVGCLAKNKHFVAEALVNVEFFLEMTFGLTRFVNELLEKAGEYRREIGGGKDHGW